MRRNVLLMAAVAVAGLASGLESVSAARAPDTAVPTATITAPRVLSAEDVRFYRRIFDDERRGRFRAAKKLIAELHDLSLIGYVEAERLLSPEARRVRLTQLTAWLDKYSELPVAEHIRALAEKKNRRHKVEIASLPAVHRRGGGYEDTDLPDPPLLSDAARAAQSQIQASIRAGLPAEAEAALQALIAGGMADPSDIARLSHKVAASYLAEDQDDAAARVAATVADPNRVAQPLLDWDQGLASYRLGKFDDAARHFEMLAQVGSVPNYTRSAAAFWAARAYMQAGNPSPVVSLLTAAAREQPTFYGLLAERLIGQQPQASFSEPVLDAASFEALMMVPAAHRAVALWQIGETDMLGGEMDRALAAIDLRQGPAYAALAHRLDLPNQELRACETAASRGVMLTGLFPVPRYAPADGYRIDPSLLFAFTRAESRFRADAVSGAGARGLMQIMPGTAAHMEGAAPSGKMLAKPSYNLSLGQRYLTELLGQLNGNLIELAAAYNAGPGALTRWIGARGTALDDPLLFIESLPAVETRAYVKKVLTYYWMYARRSGDEAPTLDETATGKWPRYHSYTVQQPAANTLVSDATTPY